MTSELSAQIALAVYAAIAASMIAVQLLRSRAGWKAWLLYAVERTYAGLVFRVRSNRRCPFPAEGPALVVANHRSPVDPMLLWMNHHLATPRRRIRVIGFMMAREYFGVFALGWLCRAMQTIPVARDGRDMQSARKALARLKSGELLGVFPEGRLNEGDGMLEPAGVGVGWLALRSEAPVYPVFIHGAPQGNSMAGSFLVRSRVRVTYGDPIDLSAWSGRKNTSETNREVTDLIMQRLRELGGLPPSGPAS